MKFIYRDNFSIPLDDGGVEALIPIVQSIPGKACYNVSHEFEFAGYNYLQKSKITRNMITLKMLFIIIFYMGSSSWSEFDRKTSKFEKTIDENVRHFKNNHPLLERALKQSFSLLPSPFNTLAERIYDTVSGPPESKSSQVLDYVNSVKSKGQSYYDSQGWIKELNTMLQRQAEVWTKTVNEELIRQNPYYNAITWFNKGLEYNKLGQNENAITCYSKLPTLTQIQPHYFLKYRLRSLS